MRAWSVLGAVAVVLLVGEPSAKGQSPELQMGDSPRNGATFLNWAPSAGTPVWMVKRDAHGGAEPVYQGSPYLEDYEPHPESNERFLDLPPLMDPAHSVCHYCSDEPWDWHMMPRTILYQAYLAGQRESRMNTMFTYDPGLGWQWDSIVGGRAAILRYGNLDPDYPEGWQLDVEGAAFVRMNVEEQSDVDATDYRGGVWLTRREGPWETKFGYYHISSHLGDEYLERFPTEVRNDYLRDAVVLGAAYRITPDLRVYGEFGYAFKIRGPAKEWELQFGIEYAKQTFTGLYGHPYWAFNVRLREEVRWGGNVTGQLGWAWTGRGGDKFRLGFQWWTGKTHQVVFMEESEQHIGFGLWYDF